MNPHPPQRRALNMIGAPHHTVAKANHFVSELVRGVVEIRLATHAALDDLTVPFLEVLFTTLAVLHATINLRHAVPAHTTFK